MVASVREAVVSSLTMQEFRPRMGFRKKRKNKKVERRIHKFLYVN